jgi:hypothetical protein
MNEVEKLQFASSREDHKLAFELAGEYAKWFISTLLLLHSGAIAAVVQQGAGQRFACATIILALGIVLALLAALFGWFNLQLASFHYRASADALLKSTPVPSSSRSAQIAMMIAITSIIMSAIMLAIGAVLIWRQLF